MEGLSGLLNSSKPSIISSNLLKPISILRWLQSKKFFFFVFFAVQGELGCWHKETLTSTRTLFHQPPAHVFFQFFKKTKPFEIMKKEKVPSIAPTSQKDKKSYRRHETGNKFKVKGMYRKKYYSVGSGVFIPLVYYFVRSTSDSDSFHFSFKNQQSI